MVNLFKKQADKSADKGQTKTPPTGKNKTPLSKPPPKMLPKIAGRNGDRDDDDDELSGGATGSQSPRVITKIPEAPAKHRSPLEDTTEERKQSPAYSDEVMLRLTNLIYDPLATLLFDQAGIHPDEAHLLSLTRINSSREAAFWAQQISKEAAYNRYIKHHPCTWPISQVWRVAFLLARRSIPGVCGPGFTMGVSLAQEQSITKSEEAGEEGDW